MQILKKQKNGNWILEEINGFGEVLGFKHYRNLKQAVKAQIAQIQGQEKPV